LKLFKHALTTGAIQETLAAREADNPQQRRSLKAINTRDQELSPMPITENATERGYCWRYDHPTNASHHALIMACRAAVAVAAAEASKTGKTHVVASTQMPQAIYVVASDHPALSALRMKILYEMTPTAGAIRRDKTVWH
jgi:hypothetical protein